MSAPPPRHHRRHPHPLPEPAPYVLDFSAQTCRLRSIASFDDVRVELETRNRPGWQRVLVLRSLDGVVGMRGEDKVGKRGKGIAGREGEDSVGRRGEGTRGTDGWTWTFLDGVEEKLCRAELWLRGEVYILLLDGLPTWTLPCHRHPPRCAPDEPRLADVMFHAPQKSPLEEKLWETLGDARPLEEVLASVVYDSWKGVVQRLTPAQTNGEMLWRCLQALERNMDSSRVPAQWDALIGRLHQRIHLCLLLPSSTAQPQGNNTRSLNRIAYLGGLLLPLTVVSGILSIEGAYGPEGSAFWVFWLAAGLSSIAALLVIHADHLRTLDVWIEEEIFDGHRGELGVESVDRFQGAVESKGRKWQRKELGWVGAAKKMSGWYWWKGSPGMEWRKPERRMGW